MFRATVPAIVALLFVASVARAEIIDPVFVRGNRQGTALAPGQPFDSLAAFHSAGDMAAYGNQFWSSAMSSNQWGWNRWHFFDGTTYYRIEALNNAPWRLHSYGSNLGNLMADSVVSTQDFTSNPVGAQPEELSTVSFFADTDGSIYEAWSSTGASTQTNTIRKFDSVASLLAGTGTDSNSFEYNWGDTYIGVNGKFYRTNTLSPDAPLADYQIFGIAEYASFADLLSNTAAAVHGGGNGLSWDLFMAVPRAALPVGSGGPAPVPEIDPAGIGRVLVLVGGVLGLLERRRTRA
jgi:hypothetical protein